MSGRTGRSGAIKTSPSETPRRCSAQCSTRSSLTRPPSCQCTPSRAKDDPLYDDRLTQMLNAIRPSSRSMCASSSCKPRRQRPHMTAGVISPGRARGALSDLAEPHATGRASSQSATTCSARAATSRLRKACSRGPSRCAHNRPFHRPTCAGGSVFQFPGFGG